MRSGLLWSVTVLLALALGWERAGDLPPWFVVLLILGLLTVVFFVVRLMPGDPAELVGEQHLSGEGRELVRQRLQTQAVKGDATLTEAYQSVAGWLDAQWSPDTCPVPTVIRRARWPVAPAETSYQVIAEIRIFQNSDSFLSNMKDETH